MFFFFGWHRIELEDLKKELCSVIGGTYGAFLSEASFQLKQNGEIAAVIS